MLGLDSVGALLQDPSSIVSCSVTLPHHHISSAATQYLCSLWLQDADHRFCSENEQAMEITPTVLTTACNLEVMHSGHEHAAFQCELGKEL